MTEVYTLVAIRLVKAVLKLNDRLLHEPGLFLLLDRGTISLLDVRRRAPFAVGPHLARGFNIDIDLGSDRPLVKWRICRAKAYCPCDDAREILVLPELTYESNQMMQTKTALSPDG